MKIIGCDLSKSSTGLAGWDGKTSRPVVISKPLGDGALTTEGVACARLHMLLNDMVAVLGGVDAIYCEKPNAPTVHNGHTNFETLLILYGLYCHASSFAAAKGISSRFYGVRKNVWGVHFMGGVNWGKKRKDTKSLSLERARQLGFHPKNDDESDAVGVLGYGCERQGIIPPWIEHEVLRPPLGAPA